jgi:hypothetical protein
VNSEDSSNVDFDLLELDHLDSLQNLRKDEESEAQHIQLEKRGVSSHREVPAKGQKQDQLQGNFWTSQTVFKFSIAAKLRTIGMTEIADDLEKCHSEITYAKCTSCSRVSKFLNRCDRFYCPECQPRLSRERKEAVEWWTKEVVQPKHVVLTVRNTDTLQKSDVQELKKAFSRLRRTKFARNWTGGFYSLEVTNEGRGWHLHIHALVDAKWIDARALAIEWNKATRGNGQIVKVKDCRNKSYLQEVTKYAVKGNDLAKWEALDIKTFIDAFSGVKSFGVFGSLYGKRTEFREWIDSLKETRTICSCGCNTVNFFDERSWEVLEAQLTPQTAPPPPKIPKNPEFDFVSVLDRQFKVSF